MRRHDVKLKKITKISSQDSELGSRIKWQTSDKTR